MKTFLGILFFTIVSCGQNDSAKQTQFLKFKNTIIPTVFKTYPISEEEINNSEAQIINYADSYKYLGYASIFQIYKYTNDEFVKRHNDLISKSKMTIDYNEKCNLIIPDTLDNYDKLCAAKNNPAIPSIDNNANKLNRFVGKDSKFYILDYGSKNILKGIVSKQSHFSVGAIVNESNKTILYWIIAL